MSTGYLLNALNRPGNQGSGLPWVMICAWVFLALPIASMNAWGTWLFWHFEKSWPMVILTATAFIVAAGVVSRLQLLPRSGGWGVVLLCVLLSFLAVVFILAFWRLYYSRTFLATIYPLGLLILLAGCRKGIRIPPRRLALVPGGLSDELDALPGFQWQSLQKPELNEPVDGVVVDLHEELPFSWGLFLSDCALKRIPVYHAAVIFEEETGRASMSHFSEGLLSAVQIATLHAAFKRVADVLLILLSLPVWAPLFVAVALAVKMTSPGPVFFWQQRIGQSERPFRMVKFRSMVVAAEANGSAFAAHQDARVTAVGKFIRKVRLDELPQFWNVLKGDMSLIGPRPEQVEFARKFKEEIPYYGYRHVVKPGITGWAQVNHGYADDNDATQHKVEFDLYYIKHLNFWIDFLILIKTIRIVLTGAGAR